MRSFKNYILFSMLTVLTACSSTGDSSSGSSAPNIDPNSVNKGSSNLIEDTYTSRSGVNIAIQYRYDGLLRGYGMGVRRIDGDSFDKTDASYQLVQSIVREYFYAKVCSDGYHPGVIYNFYTPMAETGETWAVKLKCFSQAQDAKDNPKSQS